MTDGLLTLPGVDRRKLGDSISEVLYDALLAHRHLLFRIENAIIRDLLASFADAYGEIDVAVARILGPYAADVSGVSRASVVSLEAEIDRIIIGLESKVATSTRAGLSQVARYELAEQNRIIRAALPKVVPWNVRAMTSSEIASIVDTPYRGSYWYDRIGRGMAEARVRMRSGFSYARVLGGDSTTVRDAIARPVGTELRARVVGTLRTESGRVANSALMQAYRDNAGTVDSVTVVETLDDITCLVCATRDGLVLEVSAPEIEFPPYHPNCLPGDGYVSPRGRVLGVSKRWYDGDIVVVGGTGDFPLACTPNHPILTRFGWVPAGSLQVGDEVAYAPSGQRMLARNGENVEAPARAEDIARTFFESSRVTTAPMPISAEDFHGDGVDGEVAIIGTDRLLTYGQDAASQESFVKLGLLRRYAAQPTLAGLRALPRLFRANDATARAFVRSIQAFETSVGIEKRPLRSFGFARGTQGDADPTKGVLYGLPTTAEARGDSPRSVAVAIQAGDLVFGKVQSLGHRRYRGWVYNFETTEGYYIANSVATHNCRGFAAPVIRAWDEMGLHAGDLRPKERDALDGRVPGSVTYEEWFKRQSEKFQRDLLGPTRYDLYASGKLEIKQFVRDFRILRLDELPTFTTN